MDHLENYSPRIGCLPPGIELRRQLPFKSDWIKFVQPVGIKIPEEPYETYTDADPGYWYFIDEPKFKKLEWEESMSPYPEATIRMIDGAAKEPPEVKEIDIDVNIQIKDGHILAEFGCVKHICHNLQELMAVAKKELLKEMPILKDFGKPKKESTNRVVKKKATDTKES